MNAEFSNAYQEIMLDNLLSIIKQNFVFQTQLKLAENISKQKAELEVKYNDLIASSNSMQTKLNEAERIKSISNLNESAHQEKQRIQSALNEEMKKSVALTKNLEEKNTEINNLKEYINKLEQIVPASKLKKINSEKAIETLKEEKSASSELFTIKENDGSSF